MNKDRLITVETYCNWIVGNVVPCLLPIGIIWGIGSVNKDLDLSVVFSSILAFLFTLLITSVYTFYPFTRLKKGLIGGEILFSFSVLGICLILALFVLYNSIPNLEQGLNADMGYWSLLLLALVLAVLLNRPAIRDRIREKQGAIKLVDILDTFNKGEQMGAKWMDILGGGKPK